MTMHLEGPWLTTTGKIRSKRRKFASAEAAARDRELRAEWQQRQQEWAKVTPHFATQPSRAVLLSKPHISSNRSKASNTVMPCSRAKHCITSTEVERSMVIDGPFVVAW